MLSGNLSAANNQFRQKILDPRVWLIAILVAQTGFFVLFAEATTGKWLRGDNNLYETPAWNFAQGKGLSIARSDFEDPYLTDLYYKTHPEKAGSELIPSATMPIGYSTFLGLIYTVFGRSHLAAILVNLILLYAVLLTMFVIAKRVFAGRPEFYLVLALMLLFPFWAIWAATIIGDTLHVLLITLFALLFFVEKPSFKTVVVCGALLGLASLVRPYSMLLPIALFAIGFVLRRNLFTFKNTAIAAIVCWLILGGWALRNYYEFGRPMLTSIGLGHSIWFNTHKRFFEDVSDAEVWAKMPADITDYHRHADNRRLLEIGIERIKADPVRDVALAVASIPRLWMTLGGANSPALLRFGLFAIFGSLFVLMIAGIFFARKSGDPILLGAIAVVLYYTAIFAHLSIEGRYTLPARFFGFLLAAIALARLLRRIFPGIWRDLAATETVLHEK